jgi:hypothetical protein
MDKLKFTLEALVFVHDLDPQILQIWNGIKAMLELHGEDIE